MNYVPLLFYEIVIARKGSAKSEVDYGSAHNKHFIRKYGSQQFMILVPLVVLLIALIQRRKEIQFRGLW